MNKREELIELLLDDERLTFADGFDEAIIGTNYDGSKVVYLFSKAVEILCREMNEEDALEHLYFNHQYLMYQKMKILIHLLLIFL